MVIMMDKNIIFDLFIYATTFLCYWLVLSFQNGNDSARKDFRAILDLQFTPTLDIVSPGFDSTVFEWKDYVDKMENQTSIANYYFLIDDYLSDISFSYHKVAQVFFCFAPVIISLFRGSPLFSIILAVIVLFAHILSKLPQMRLKKFNNYIALISVESLRIAIDENDPAIRDYMETAVHDVIDTYKRNVVTDTVFKVVSLLCIIICIARILYYLCF